MCPLRVELRRCDIATVQADVCVSSIHRSKNMKMGCLSSHILDSAGTDIQHEMYQKQPGRELEIGQVEAVTTGKLKNFKELMFICLRSYIPGNDEILQQSVFECLELAAVKNHKSIAFPALGTGQGYDPEKVANCLLEAFVLHNYQYPETSLEIVYIVLFDKDIELIKTFLLMCMKGTTDIHSDDTSQQATAEDCEKNLMSGLTFGGAQNIVDMDDSFQVTAKPRNTQKSQMPKASQPKMTGPQRTVLGNKNSFFSRLTKLFMASKGLSFDYKNMKVNVQPKISRKLIGLQLNVGLDISFIDKFIPPQLGKFLDAIL